MNKNLKLLLFAVLVLTLCIATVGLSACKDNTDKTNLTVTYDYSHTIYEGDDIDSLKPYLTVIYTEKNGTSYKFRIIISKVRYMKERMI